MKLTLIAAFAALLALPAYAHDGVHIIDPYARVIGPSGAVFFRIGNDEAVEDRLIAAASPDAGMVMLMSTNAGSDGVMKMADAPEGFSVPANGERVLASAGDHVMLMSLTRSLKAGDTVSLVLTFEKACEVHVSLPVDNDRKTPPGMGPTPNDAESGHEAAVLTDGPQSTPLNADQQAIVDVMKAMFDKPEAPLSVDPVVVMGDAALASWAQGDMGGRALLARKDGVWSITLCGGPDLRAPEFLAANGVKDADMLSQMFNSVEDQMGADKVAFSSKFPQVVMMSTPPAN